MMNSFRHKNYKNKNIEIKSPWYAWLIIDIPIVKKIVGQC